MTARVSATVVSWHDGDTFYGVVDLGSLRLFYGRDRKPERCRAAVIQAPELEVAGQPNPAGLAARDFATALAPPGDYPCWCYGWDTYGRPLIDLILPDGRQFSEAMLVAGQARPYGR